MRATDVEGFEQLSLTIERAAAVESRYHLVPLVRREKLEATLAVDDEVGDVEAVMSFALQDLTKARGDTHPAFFVDRMVEPTVEHRAPPRSTTTSHCLPLESRCQYLLFAT